MAWWTTLWLNERILPRGWALNAPRILIHHGKFGLRRGIPRGLRAAVPESLSHNIRLSVGRTERVREKRWGAQTDEYEKR